MTIPSVDTTTLTNLVPNLDVGDIADPALRLAAFQYIYAELAVIVAEINSLPTANIQNLSITAAKLAALSVETAKIAELAVVTSKLAEASVTLSKMAANSVGTTQLVDGSVNAVKVMDGVLTAAKFVPGALTNDTENALRITAVEGDFTELAVDTTQRGINVKSAPYNAKGDGSDDTAAFEAAIIACPNGGIIVVPDGHYVLSSQLAVDKAITFIGQGLQTTILNLVNCDGILVTVSDVKFQDIRIYSTSTDGIKRTGIRVDNGLTRIDNFQLENVDLSEWSTALLLFKVWNMNLTNLLLSFVRDIGIHTSGLSVNNQLSGVRITAKTYNVSESKGIFFNGAAAASEGWMLSNCLIVGFGINTHAQQMSHVIMTNCILDFGGSKGILLESVGANVSGGWLVSNNYIAANGLAGIHDANTADTGNLAYGNIFSNNKILSYNGAVYGIRCDNNSQKNIITGNTIRNFAVNDISGIANDHIVTGNKCHSELAANIDIPGLVANNHGIVHYERSVNYATIGKIKLTYDEAIPTVGTWNAGDICYKVNPSEAGTAGSKYVLNGWRCIAGGTPGIWVEMRALTGN